MIRERVIDEVVSYHPGTAGSSLKQALAAANLLIFPMVMRTGNFMYGQDATGILKRISRLPPPRAFASRSRVERDGFATPRSIFEISD